jgi:hypothetical protein
MRIEYKEIMSTELTNRSARVDRLSGTGTATRRLHVNKHRGARLSGTGTATRHLPIHGDEHNSNNNELSSAFGLRTTTLQPVQVQEQSTNNPNTAVKLQAQPSASTVSHISHNQVPAGRSSVVSHVSVGSKSTATVTEGSRSRSATPIRGKQELQPASDAVARSPVSRTVNNVVNGGARKTRRRHRQRKTQRRHRRR